MPEEVLKNVRNGGEVTNHIFNLSHTPKKVQLGLTIFSVRVGNLKYPNEEIIQIFSKKVLTE